MFTFDIAYSKQFSATLCILFCLTSLFCFARREFSRKPLKLIDKFIGAFSYECLCIAGALGIATPYLIIGLLLVLTLYKFQKSQPSPWVLILKQGLIF